MSRRLAEAAHYGTGQCAAAGRRAPHPRTLQQRVSRRVSGGILPHRSKKLRWALTIAALATRLSCAGTPVVAAFERPARAGPYPPPCSFRIVVDETDGSDRTRADRARARPAVIRYGW